MAAFPRGDRAALGVQFCLVFAFPDGVEALKVPNCAVLLPQEAAASAASCSISDSQGLDKHFLLPRKRLHEEADALKLYLCYCSGRWMQ